MSKVLIGGQGAKCYDHFRRHQCVKVYITVYMHARCLAIMRDQCSEMVTLWHMQDILTTYDIDLSG